MANIVKRENQGGMAARETASPVMRRQRDFDPLREFLRFDPFQEMTRLWRGEEPYASFMPAFDVRETTDAFVFKADVPGLREGDIDINVTGNRLTISGRRESDRTEESDTYFCSERWAGSFTRTFTLPPEANLDQIRAEMREGVLTVQVPKTPEAQPKKVAISSGSGTDEGRAKA